MLILSASIAGPAHSHLLTLAVEDATFCPPRPPATTLWEDGEMLISSVFEVLG